MDKKFELEQEILSCWNIIDDLKTITDRIIEHSDFEGMNPEYEDKITNLLMGLESIYQIKFEKCFETFEELTRCLTEKQ